VVQRRMNRRPQVREHVPPLLAARLDDALEVGGEGVAPVALAAEARLPPGDQATQLPLGVIVRWLDRRIVDKAPQSIAMFEDVATRSANAGDGQISTFFEQPFDGAPESERDALQSCARTGAVARAVIAVNEQARPKQQLAADLTNPPGPLGEIHELSDQMSLIQSAA